MNKRLLLIVIYLAFISLGLPDSLLGAAWPTMFQHLAVPIHYAGFISMIVAAGTVISSLLSAGLIRKFGTAAITTTSVLMTAMALLGFSYSHQFIFLCLLAVPLGLGAGCIDAALNNYVALHYDAKHMNWLHCFWGIGAAIGPLLMSKYLVMGESWAKGYNTVAWIQISIAVILFISFPLWINNNSKDEHASGGKTSVKTLIAIPGLKQMLIIFFCYCTIEATFGLWGASYLVFVRGFEPAEAAKYVSFYYLGITLGRFFSGFISSRVNNLQMVYFGQGIIILSIIILMLPFRVTLFPGFFLIGLGCAPIFPALLHETPRNFGEQYSQSIMGMQMASAYVGITLMPFLFGKLASCFSYSSLIWFIAVVLFLKIFLNYGVNQKVAMRKKLLSTHD